MPSFLEKRIENVENWLILNTGSLPYIIGYGVRQFTDKLYKRYPKNYLINFCGIRMIKNGSEGQYFVNQDEYLDSFVKIIENKNIIEQIYSDFLRDEAKFKEFILLLEKNGDDYLNENFEEFTNVYDSEYISGGTIDGVLVYGESFFNEMKLKYPDYEKEIRILTEQSGETFLNRYNQELLKLAIKYKSVQLKSIDEVLKNIELKLALKKIQKYLNITSFH